MRDTTPSEQSPAVRAKPCRQSKLFEESGKQIYFKGDHPRQCSEVPPRGSVYLGTPPKILTSVALLVDRGGGGGEGEQANPGSKYSQ